MSGSILGAVSAARWYLPVRTAGDQGTADRAECGAIDASFALSDSPIKTQRLAPFARTEPGDPGDAHFPQAADGGLRDAQAEGRQIVADASTSDLPAERS